jgi:hypothetical protein
VVINYRGGTVALAGFILGGQIVRVPEGTSLLGGFGIMPPPEKILNFGCLKPHFLRFGGTLRET